MNSTNYHRIHNEQQLQAVLAQSTESSRGSLVLQPPQNTFDRQTAHMTSDAWSKPNAFVEPQSSSVRAIQQQLQLMAIATSSQPQQKTSNQVSIEHQQSLRMGLDLQNVTAVQNSTHRHSSAKHSLVQRSQEAKGGFFGSLGSSQLGADADDDDNSSQFLNKTQVVGDSSQSGYANERGNRTNVHRSGRQRSHQNTGQVAQQDGTELLYELKMQTGYQTKGDQEGQGKVKKLASDLDVGFYHQQCEGVKNPHHYRYAQMAAEESEIDNSLTHLQPEQFSQSQKLDSTFSHQDFKSSQTQPKEYSQAVSSVNGQRLAQGLQLLTQTRRASDSNHATNNHKKKVQPQQLRSREDSRRKGASGINGHNKSSETTNSYDQSSQNSSQCQQPPPPQQPNAGPQTLKIDSDKFSQLVCQVPQGSNKPHSVPQVNNLIQVQESNQNYGTQSYLLGPQRAAEAGRKTLVLDLDETLVHSSFKPVENADIMLPVEIDGQICTIYVLVRPFVAQFLKQMHKIFELVIFTASLSKYAEPLMQTLDPQKMCSYLLFREHCTFFSNAYVKDLTRLGRPMKDVIIVDNSPTAYLFQPENAMPAVSWYDDPNDTELNRIATLLERLSLEDDVRKVIRTVIQNNKIDPRQEQLYLASSTHRREKSQRADRRTKHSKLTSSNVQAAPDQQPLNIQKMHNKQYPQENQPSIAFGHDLNQNAGSLRNVQQEQAHHHHHGEHHQIQSTSTHSRYDSSDTRQRNAALIAEELNQRKRGDENLNIDIVLANVQKLTQQTKNLHYETELKKNMQQNQKDIQQAYQHHKNQILQLQNEIAALKSQHSDQTPRSGNTHRQIDESDAAVSQRNHLSKTTSHAQRVAHQPIGDGSNQVSKVKEASSSTPTKSSVNKGQKQHRESSRHQQQQQHYEAQAAQQQQQIPTDQKAQSKGTLRNSYKMLSTNEIQLVNYLKNGSGQSHQRQSNTAAPEKKQVVVREAQPENSQLQNTKQIIKLIKKSESHFSNSDVSSSARQQIDGAQMPNMKHGEEVDYSTRQQHPATTKSQTKQAFAFTANGAASNQAQTTMQSDNQRQRQSLQSQGQLFDGQINMMTQATGTSRGQQASRTSSKTTKNYSSASQNQTATLGNMRTSYSGYKTSANQSKPTAQSSLQTHERISANSAGASTTKRSSSVKNQGNSTHQGQLKGGISVGSENCRKSISYPEKQPGSSGYSNLAAYESTVPGQPRRERGSSAQPLYTGSSHTNPLLIKNLVTRSSSTTNKNKKTNSISGTGNFHNLVLTGSHSTKHSTQPVQHPNSGQTTASILQTHVNQRGASHERQQRTSSKNSSRAKQAPAGNAKSTSQLNGTDSRDDSNHHQHQQHPLRASSNQQVQQYTLKQQQEHLQRMQQMTSAVGTKQQLSATQRISPGTMLSLTGQHPYAGQSSQQQLSASLTPSNQAHAVVKQNLKDIQISDMLRLTQSNAAAPLGYTNMSSTRNSKQIEHTGGQLAPEADDFLQKVKLQQQQQATLKQNKDIFELQQQQPRRESKQPTIQMLQQEVAVSKSSQGHQTMGGLSINSPKYFSGSLQVQPGVSGSTREHQKILNDIMNMAMQREQKSGSATTSYGVKQVAMTAPAGQTSAGGHQIKKIRISSTQQSQNGRISGQSNQSAPNPHQKSSGLKRGDSNNSRGSHSNAAHQTMRTSSSGVAAKSSVSKDHQARQTQFFNQTMKLKESGARGGAGSGIISLLSEMHEKDVRNQTAADLFLQSHNEGQFSQTQYFGSSQNTQLGHSQLHEVTRHFYNQLAGTKKQ